VTRRLLAAPLALLVALAAVLAVASPAQAADHVVRLSQTEQDNSTITIRSGDTVTFTNTDSVSHRVKSGSKWSFDHVIASGKSQRTNPFTQPDTYGYTDSYVIGLIPRTVTGNIVVVPASPSPSSTPRPSSSPRPSASASPKPTTSASPSAAPTPSGVAVPPPIIGGVAPTPTASGSPGPPPQVASGGQTPSGTATTPVTHVDYANPAGIVQHSSHGTGLPVALAVLAALGVLTLLIRVLLSAPEARHDIR
jgi:plastocyanin